MSSLAKCQSQTNLAGRVLGLVNLAQDVSFYGEGISCASSAFWRTAFTRPGSVVLNWPVMGFWKPQLCRVTATQYEICAYPPRIICSHIEISYEIVMSAVTQKLSVILLIKNTSHMIALYSCNSDLCQTHKSQKSCYTIFCSCGTTVVTRVPREKPLLGGILL